MKEGVEEHCTLHIRICLRNDSFFFSFVQIYALQKRRIENADATIENIINFLVFFSEKDFSAWCFILYYYSVCPHEPWAPKLNDKKLKILCILYAYFFSVVVILFYVLFFSLPGVMANGMESYKIYDRQIELDSC